MTTTTRIKERPILFSSEMVRAILGNHKQMTRRVVTWSNSYVSTPKKFLYDLNRAWSDHSFRAVKFHRYLHVPFAHPEDGWEENPDDDTVGRWYSRHEVGDRLWVRETWQQIYPIGEGQWATCNLVGDMSSARIIFAADCEEEPPTWRPSIHMPRWASRITLEVTDVRVECVRDITETDARAEGCKPSEKVELKDGSPCYTDSFQQLWKTIHGVDNPKAWENNPPVWATSFRKLEEM